MAEFLRLRVAADPVANDGTGSFTVVSVEESEGDVITPGTVDSSTLFSVTDPAENVVVRLLGTLHIEGSATGWRRLAGGSIATVVFTLTASGDGDSVESTGSVTLRNDGDLVGPTGITAEVWVGGDGGDNGSADFSCAVSLADAAVVAYPGATPSVGALVLEDVVVEVRMLDGRPVPGEDDVATFVGV